MNSKVRQPRRPRAKSLFAKFDRGGRTSFIEEVIVLDRVEELELCPPDSHSKQSLSDLTKGLDAAIVLGRRALELCPPGHPHRIASLNNLVVYLCTRYDQLQVVGDLDAAITLAREALKLCPSGQPNRSQSLNNLAIGLSSRYEHLGEMKDLDEAIDLGREALKLHPPGYPHRYQTLNNLAVDLSTRYKKLGTMTDLNEVIALDAGALKLCPPGHYSRLQSLNSLVVGLSARYKQLGAATDLDEVIFLGEEVLKCCSRGHPDRSTYLNSLAFDLFARYEKVGAITDLDVAIAHDREALELRPPGYPNRSTSLNNLAVDLSTRYKKLGTVTDLDEAIVLDREALELQSPGHPDRSTSLNNLAVGLSTRHKQLGTIMDLDEAIAFNREALELRPPGHPDRLQSLSNLAVVLSARHKQLGVMTDLDQALVVNREALELCSLGHPDRSTSLNNLAVDLSTRYQQLRKIMDLDEAIALNRKALELRPQAHPYRSQSLNNLSADLSTRYKQHGAVDDINAAIVLGREALDLRPPGHPERSSSLDCLTSSLRARIAQQNKMEEAKELFSLFAELAHVPETGSLADLSFARAWVHAAEDFQHTTTLLAYETSLRLLIRHLAGLPPSFQSLNVLKRDASSLAVDAFSACIRAHAPFKAVELLEQGRCVFYNQFSRVGPPLDDVIAHGHGGKMLADEFTQLASLIHNCLGLPYESQHDRVRYLSVELQRVMADIRKLPGLSRFLLPLDFSDLQRAASGGPIIIVNASQYSCDALVVLLDRDPVHIPLQITKEDVLDLSAELHTLTQRAKRLDVTKELASLLRELWDRIVSIIVDFLQTIFPSQSRIWWCPTAEFSVLPLHAAGPYRKDQRNLADIYISSYTPTLSALIRARRPSSLNSTGDGTRFVAIGQSMGTGDSSELRVLSVTTELANIGQHIDGVATFTCTNGQESCMSRVVEEFSKNQWVHLACHSVLDYKEPSRSAFVLHDGRLTIEDIIRSDLKNPEFVCLSCSQTTVGDEESPDEVLHLTLAMQFAGFRSIIGTMGDAGVDEMNEIMSMFYGHMVGESGCLNLNHTRAASALNKTLKSVHVPLDQRILYIHLGA